MGEMKVQLQPRRFYGKLLYNAICEKGKMFVEFHRRPVSKSPMLTKREVDIIKKLGFEVELIPYLEEGEV